MNFTKWVLLPAISHVVDKIIREALGLRIPKLECEPSGEVKRLGKFRFLGDTNEMIDREQKQVRGSEKKRVSSN